MAKPEMNNMTEEKFEGVGGLKIFVRSWRPPGKPRGTMILVHGFNAHGGYMQWSGEQFAADGFAAYALDLRGRGKSEGVPLLPRNRNLPKHLRRVKYYSVPEMQAPLETELAKFFRGAELTQILATSSKATQIMGLQSKAIKGLFDNQVIVVLQFIDMQRSIKDFLLQQGRCERIKDFPYPRQFATINSFFTKLFCLLLLSVCSGNSTASMKASRG